MPILLQKEYAAVTNLADGEEHTGPEIIRNVIRHAFRSHAEKISDDPNLIECLASVSCQFGGPDQLALVVEADKGIALPGNWEAIKLLLRKHLAEKASLPDTAEVSEAFKDLVRGSMKTHDSTLRKLR